jgi:hypothetical protein
MKGSDSLLSHPVQRSQLTTAPEEVKVWVISYLRIVILILVKLCLSVLNYMVMLLGERGFNNDHSVIFPRSIHRRPKDHD